MELQFAILSWVVPIIYLLILGCFVYGFVLFVKLARRGIKALDLYVNDKTSNRIE